MPGLGGAEGRVESKSQVMPSRPIWPPEEGKATAMSGLQALGFGRMQMAPGARRIESFYLARIICEGFLQEVVLEAESEELVGFERRRRGRAGGCERRRHTLNHALE